VIARKKKSTENPATQEGNIQAVPIIFVGQLHHCIKRQQRLPSYSREACLCATKRWS